MKRYRLSVLLLLLFLLSGAVCDAEAQDTPPHPPADGSSGSPLLSLAEQGDAAAQYGLGVLHGNGNGGMPQDFARAAHWFHKAAAQGHAQAAAAVAFLKRAGLVVPPPAEGDEPVPALVDAALVQVATVGSEATGKVEWKRQKRLHADMLGTLNPVIHTFPVGEKVMYRVMGGPVEITEARDLCARLKTAGGACHVVRVESLSPPQERTESQERQERIDSSPSIPTVIP